TKRTHKMINAIIVRLICLFAFSHLPLKYSLNSTLKEVALPYQNGLKTIMMKNKIAKTIVKPLNKYPQYNASLLNNSFTKP
ncbi:MAG: hypothetical protein K2K01_00255, partial [Eubacterium sp.]|nr:hypothetical protein [Eubacterium sp.]